MAWTAHAGSIIPAIEQIRPFIRVGTIQEGDLAIGRNRSSIGFERRSGEIEVEGQAIETASGVIHLESTTLIVYTKNVNL